MFFFLCLFFLFCLFLNRKLVLLTIFCCCCLTKTHKNTFFVLKTILTYINYKIYTICWFTCICTDNTTTDTIRITSYSTLLFVPLTLIMRFVPIVVICITSAYIAISLVHQVALVLMWFVALLITTGSSTTGGTTTPVFQYAGL